MRDCGSLAEQEASHMHRHFLAALLASTALAGATAARADDVADASDTAVDGVLVQGQYGPTSTATGLGLTLRETPQSVTVIPRQQIEDFALDNVNDLLKQV